MHKAECHFLFLNSHDPFYNLGFEEFILRNCPENIFYAILWRNNPSVILGNFQNPWREVNFDILNQKNINLVRRQSGGGTVYHDQGNLNFSFIAHKNFYNEDFQFKLIINSLADLGFDCQVGSRKEISVKHDNEFFKITGSAFKRTKDIYLQHGTLLINSDLSILNKVLLPEDLQINSKAVDSVRSTVINLSDIIKISIEDFSNALINQLQSNFEIFNQIDDSSFATETIKANALKLRSFEQVYGRTPKFEIVVNDCKYTIKNGLIESVSQDDLKHLVGSKFQLDLMS